MLATQSIESQDPEQEVTAVKPVATADRRRRLVWVVVGLVVACFLGVAAIGVVGARSCSSCHGVGAFLEQTQASPHAKVECRACHMSPGAMGELAFATRRPLHRYFRQAGTANRDAAAVPDSRCTVCHEDTLDTAVVSNGIRISHVKCATTSSCTDCHSSIAHGTETKWVRSYDMDLCLECHLASQNVACDLCHEDRATVKRVKFAAFGVTHGPKWKTTHGMGNAATCTVCHTERDCASCHGVGVPHAPKFVEVHASYVSDPKSRCSTCHKDAFCAGCHGTPMPHPASFTPKHAALSKAQPQMCKRCHDETDCTNCHLKHVHPGGSIALPAPSGGGK